MTEDQDLITIDGVVEHVVYQNEDTGYTVCEVATAPIDRPTQEELITLVGNLPYLAEGETVRAMGKWVVHPNFGRQFKVSYFEKQLPATSDAILKYLSSRAVKGVGPKTAQRIVAQFGVESFDVMENHPEYLADIPGISYQKALEIQKDFKQQFGMRNVMMFCRDYFGAATSVRIYKKWGAAAVDIIKRNPYLLCDEFHGIGFERADRIAKTLGVEEYTSERQMAMIKYFLSQNALQNGHVYLPKDAMIKHVAELLDTDRERIADALDALEQAGSVKILPIEGRTVVYLQEYYQAEQRIVRNLCRLEKNAISLNVNDIDRFVTQVEREDGITYAPMQRKAIRGALQRGLFLLTGGPGTGKTTIVRGVIRIFEKMGMKIALAAPTGRAAKRMSEATQMEAKTIHRLLEMEYTHDATPKFLRDESNFLSESVIVIDEASMVDTVLFDALLRAIKPGAKLILIGDADQLPSVGAGNVLRDLLRADCFTTVRLTEIFRQAEESMIVKNAHAINAGELPELEVKDKDFFFLSRQTEEEMKQTVVNLCLNRLPKTYGEEIKEKIQVLCPSRKGEVGTHALNVMLQQYLNPPSPKKREKKYNGVIFREGDKVMQIHNNYDIPWEKDGVEGVGIFNGDIGRIVSIDVQKEQLTIHFDDRVAIYEFSLLEELEHSYAITVHKSQGSEYPVVILPVYAYTGKLLTRNLLYTAVTRAQSMVIMVGRADVVQRMVENNRQLKRFTGLKEFLGETDL